MRFGGHETFHLRPGWLAKGIAFVASGDTRPFADPGVADELGVGRNMAKSIQFWLVATGLMPRTERRLAAFGELVYKHDPYLQHRATWWAIHANLATSPDTVWHWFWNDFRVARFDRLRCQEGLQQHLERHDRPPKSIKSLQREVAVLLQTYRRALPADDDDPEDNLDCPLRHLGLLVLHTDLDQFERRSAWGRTPAEILAYTIARGRSDGPAETAAAEVVDIGFAELLHNRFGPGRLLQLDADGLADELARAEGQLGADTFRTRLLAGERTITLEGAPPIKWLARFYDRVEAG
jgi:hypothetical protein